MDERTDKVASDPSGQSDGMLLPGSAYEEEMTEEDRLLLKEADHQYTGSFSHTIDAKGRMVVPLAFRTMLGPKFYIAPSHDFQAIGLYSNVAWARMRHRYATLDPLNDHMLTFLEFFNALSFRDQECDGQGRVLLPARIRAQMLGDEKELEISGAGYYVRVMSSKAYMEQFAAFRQMMPDVKKTINMLEARRLGQ